MLSQNHILLCYVESIQECIKLFELYIKLDKYIIQIDADGIVKSYPEDDNYPIVKKYLKDDDENLSEYDCDKKIIFDKFKERYKKECNKYNMEKQIEIKNDEIVIFKNLVENLQEFKTSIENEFKVF